MMPSKERVLALVARVEQGQILEAFEEFYADDVEMRENGNPATVGKDANRKREEEFVASVARVHENRAASVVADGDLAVIHWVLDFTAADGNRYRMDQLAHQTWRDGRIVSERFFYDSASVAVSAPAVAEELAGAV